MPAVMTSDQHSPLSDPPHAWMVAWRGHCAVAPADEHQGTSEPR